MWHLSVLSGSFLAYWPPPTTDSSPSSHCPPCWIWWETECIRWERTWTASKSGASLLLSVVLLCTFTLIEIRNSRLSRSLCRGKTPMMRSGQKRVVYLDDCSVQIILSPGVWLLSCSRFQFKNYLRRQACLTTVNNVHGGQSCLTLSSHLTSTNILYFMFWKQNTTPWQLCYSWSSLQPKKVTDPTCPWLWGQSQDSLRKYFISMITGVNKNNTREPPPTLERHESGI